MKTDAVDARVQQLTEARRRDGARKQDTCLAAVERLTSGGHPVTFAEVQRIANVSSWFVYNNPTVRGAIEDARAQPALQDASARASRTDIAGLRSDLALARDEVRQLREERDILRARIRRGLGAAIEQRDVVAVVARADSAEKQRDLLQTELHEVRVQMAMAKDDLQLLRDERDAARSAVKRMMRVPAADAAT